LFCRNSIATLSEAADEISIVRNLPMTQIQPIDEILHRMPLDDIQIIDIIGSDWNGQLEQCRCCNEAIIY
jgi:hypothetical protein